MLQMSMPHLRNYPMWPSVTRSMPAGASGLQPAWPHGCGQLPSPGEAGSGPAGAQLPTLGPPAAIAPTAPRSLECACCPGRLIQFCAFRTRLEAGPQNSLQRGKTLSPTVEPRLQTPAGAMGAGAAQGGQAGPERGLGRRPFHAGLGVGGKSSSRAQLPHLDSGVWESMILPDK